MKLSFFMKTTRQYNFYEAPKVNKPNYDIFFAYYILLPEKNKDSLKLVRIRGEKVLILNYYWIKLSQLIKIQYIFFDAEKIMGSHYIPKRKLKLT